MLYPIMYQYNETDENYLQLLELHEVKVNKEPYEI